MSFYEQIGKYYDHIFPVGEQQLNFIKQTAGSPPKKILDVACGSGGYSVALAREGYLLQAIDLDDEMVRLAREKAKKEKLDVEVSKCDMKDIEGRFKMEFDGVFCIGNSIVHLGSLSEITDVLKQMNSVLRQGGFLILQTINYDRVLKYGINELPPIRDDSVGLEFVRKYELREGKALIDFNTVLTVEGRRFENSVPLFPLTSGDMMEALNDARFRDIRFYGDFNRSVYDDHSFMLVVRARK